MTGRDLIIYILKNGLEDKEVFDGENMLGFETLTEAASRNNCGEASILVLCQMHHIPIVNINGKSYIPVIKTIQ